MTGTSAEGGRRTSHRDTAPVITDARGATSAELRSREVRYAITMGFRTACFLAMIVVTGPMRWVLLACAVFLPGVAVVVANQANRRGSTVRDAPTDAASIDAPQLTTGAEIIESEPDDDADGPTDHRRPGDERFGNERLGDGRPGDERPGNGRPGERRVA